VTLFIACLLIYHFDMSGWWYAAALVAWLGHAFVQPTIQALLDN
jgi:hypothetical protein